MLLILVTPYNTAHDGEIGHTATIAVAVGVGGGVDLSSDVDLSGTTHTNPGFFVDTWTFHESQRQLPGRHGYGR